MSAEAHTRGVFGELLQLLCKLNNEAGGKGRRPEISMFRGDDAYGWMSNIEQHVCAKGTHEKEKLLAVVVVLRGSALIWKKWWDLHNPSAIWMAFLSAAI